MTSLENIEQDILLDRAGFMLGSSTYASDNESLLSKGSGTSQQSQRNNSSSTNNTNLPPLNERLSEDTLEDVHAFSDVKITSSNASRAASAGAVESFLEALDEIDEEEENNEDEFIIAETKNIIVNMENLAMIQEDNAATTTTSTTNIVDAAADKKDE